MNVFAKYILFVMLDLAASFLNFFLAPIVVLFASDDGWLPGWLSWFQTPEDDLDHDYRKKRFPGPQTGWKRWYSRVAWLYRNSMYGFCIDVLGTRLKASDTMLIDGDPDTGNRPLHNGWALYRIYRDGKLIYFQFYFVRAWTATMCLRLNFGWKVWGLQSGEIKRCQLTFSPNPFMGYSTNP